VTAEIRCRNLIRPEDMPYDCGTKSFGVSTVYDSGDFPALFDELLRRLDYTGARSEQVAMNSRPSGPRRGIGLAIYVEKTGLGPFETTQVEATPDGRLLVDTGASSMGPGLETVLAQILGEALGLPPSRFDVRHAAAVVADVDVETGAVTLRRVVVGADVGRAVNPALVDGQLVGGVAFGIGNTLHESLAYDAEGQLLSSTLMDYALPAAADIPPVD